MKRLFLLLLLSVTLTLGAFAQSDGTMGPPTEEEYFSQLPENRLQTADAYLTAINGFVSQNKEALTFNTEVSNRVSRLHQQYLTPVSFTQKQRALDELKSIRENDFQVYSQHETALLGAGATTNAAGIINTQGPALRRVWLLIPENEKESRNDAYIEAQNGMQLLPGSVGRLREMEKLIEEVETLERRGDAPVGKYDENNFFPSTPDINQTVDGAQQNANASDPYPGQQGVNNDELFIITLFPKIAKFLLQVSAPLILIALVYVGVQMVTASGNDEQLQNAKEYAMYLVLGVAIITLSYSIIRAIYNIFA